MLYFKQTILSLLGVKKKKTPKQIREAVVSAVAEFWEIDKEKVTDEMEIVDINTVGNKILYKLHRGVIINSPKMTVGQLISNLIEDESELKPYQQERE